MDNRAARSLISLMWQSLAYGVGIMGRQLTIYLVLPFFTRYMGREEFGVVAVTATFVAFVGVLVNVGLTPAVFRFYNDTFDENIRHLILGSSQILLVSYALPAAMVMLLAAAPLSQWILGDVAYVGIVRIVAVLIFIEALITYGSVLLRIQVRPLASSLQSLFQIMVQLGLALLLVRGCGLGARGYWLGYLGGAGLGLGLMLWLVHHSLTRQVSRQRVKELVVYALPLYPSLLALWALRLVDRWLVASQIGLREVAVYEVGYKIGMLAGLVIFPFSAAWPQFAYSSLHKPNAPRLYGKVLTYLATGCIFSALAVISFTPDLVQIMAPPAYAHAAGVAPWVAFSQVAWGFYTVTHISIHIGKRTSYIAIVTIFAAGANILLNALLLPMLGIQGAAIATLVAYAALAMLAYAVGQRFYTFPIEWARLSKLLLASGLTALLGIQLSRLDVPLWSGRVLRALGLLLFPGLLLAMRFVTPNQRRALWQTGTGLLRERLERAQPTSTR